MKRRDFLKMACAGIGLGLMPSAGKAAAEKASRPNIVLIMADDLGWGDLSCYPQQRHRPGVAMNTPNLDRLAASGVRCTDGYATCCICAPSRAGLLTGRNQQKFGYYEFYEALNGIPFEVPTIAEVLKKQGYDTALFGKWHSSQTPDNGPLLRGFDRFYGHIGGQHDYFDARIGDPCLAVGTDIDAYLWDQDKRVKDKEIPYFTDIITDKGIDFIREKARAQRSFFLYLPFTTPHPPMQAKWENLKKFYPDPDGKAFTDRDLARAMIDSLDESVGKIIAELKNQSIQNNTLVIFTSDNGGADDGEGAPAHTLVQHNGGLKLRKGFFWEGGIRVPYIVSWPGTLPSGRVYSEPVSHIDILPTAAAAAGVRHLPPDIDGVNLLPFLDGTKSDPPHETLYWGLSRDTHRWAVRHGDWKLICEMPSPVTISIDHNIRITGLYNLKEDLHEENNLIEDYPDKAIELLELKRNFYKQAKPTIVTPEQDAAWRKERSERLERLGGHNKYRRDGYPGKWRGEQYD
jgi:arylsulfatase A-like enzyme